MVWDVQHRRASASATFPLIVNNEFKTIYRQDRVEKVDRAKNV